MSLETEEGRQRQIGKEGRTEDGNIYGTIKMEPTQKIYSLKLCLDNQLEHLIAVYSELED